MHETLEDLRLLYLATRIEDSFESLEKALHRHLKTSLVREDLQVLFEGGPMHRRLRREFDRLNAFVESQVHRLEERDILQALLDCERMAHDFYLRRLDDLSDPGLVELFRGLAAEEATHAAAVEQALARLPPPAGEARR